MLHHPVVEVAQDLERVAVLFDLLAGLVRHLRGYRHQPRPLPFDVRQCLVQGAQLQVAVRAPGAPVEDEDDRPPRQEVGQAYLPTEGVGQAEVRGLVPDLETRLGHSGGQVLRGAFYDLAVFGAEGRDTGLGVLGVQGIAGLPVARYGLGRAAERRDGEQYGQGQGGGGESIGVHGSVSPGCGVDLPADCPRRWRGCERICLLRGLSAVIRGRTLVGAQLLCPSASLV